MTLRCILDGLLLPAWLRSGGRPSLVACDGDEAFALEALEARYYEVVEASREEWRRLEQTHYRLFRRATDFQWQESRVP